MLLIRAILLWSVISVHVVGGAVLFRSLFPRESVWFGFIVPALALVAILNFIEHTVALPSLLGFLPFTMLGSVWGLLQLPRHWRQMRFPIGVFLVAFTLALALRALRPDIVNKRDGVIDLSLMASFCMGEKVPPPLILYPPISLSHYYAFGHYGASVLTRLFGLDTGTGFNLSAALLLALICVLAAGIAWRVSGRKIWITLLTAFLMDGGTGASAYLALVTHRLNPNEAGVGTWDPVVYNPIWDSLQNIVWFDRPELIAPGAWLWIGALHSNTSALLLILLMVLSLVELLRRRQSNWPWICVGAIPLFSIVTSTWAVVLEGPILLAALFWIYREKFSPRNVRFVLLGLAGVIVLVLPDVLDFLTTTASPGGSWTRAEQRTPIPIFALLWWPACLPWIALLFIWSRLSAAIRLFLIVLPLFLFGMEYYAVGFRIDWTGKLWGFVYAIACVVFIPRVCTERGYPFRILTALLIFSGVVSFASWAGHAFRRISASPANILQLQGSTKFTLNPLRGPILLALSQLKGQTIIPGKSEWLDVDSPALAAFTGNYVYASWSYFDDVLAGDHTYGGAKRREDEINNLYDGKNDDPLLFLRTHHIAALVIYPDDKISKSVVSRLKTALEPLYDYSDFTDGQTEAGVFLYRPQMADFKRQSSNKNP